MGQLIHSLLPELIVAAGAVAVVLHGAVFPRRESESVSLFTLLALSAALFALIFLPERGAAGSLLARGGLPAIFRIMTLFAASLVTFLSHDYLLSRKISVSAYFTLLMLATLGMMITVGAGHLLLLYLGIELMGLSLTLMMALAPSSARSGEAALKYLMYGLTASAFMIFGLAVVFALYGTWDLAALAVLWAVGPSQTLALVLIMVGIGFKIGLVPFHLWIPDVYAGAPAPVTAFLSVGPKVAAFGAASTLFVRTLAAGYETWVPLLWIMAVLSMTWGNLGALVQRDLKRLMGYSGIAHVGYVAVGLLAAALRPLDGLGSVVFYLFAYLFFNLGFFALLIWLEPPGGGAGPTLDDVAGLGKRQPLLGGVMVLFLLALAGIPPTSGFMAKLWVFMAAVKGGMLWLAIIGVLNSALGAVYYLRVVYHIVMKNPVEGAAGPVDFTIGHFAVALGLLATVWFGLWPAMLLDMARQAAIP